MLMIVWILFALMTAAALLAVLWPLCRSSARVAVKAGSNGAVYRDQLNEIEHDLVAGSIDASEAEAARIEVSRRLLAADAAETASISDIAAIAAPARSLLRVRHLSAALAVMLTVGAGGLYLVLGSPDLPDQPLAARRAEARGDPNSIHALFARVEAHLEQHPEDGRGWEVIAPVYMRLGRYEEAAKARANALHLLGSTAQRQSDLGEALVAAENGVVSAQAKAAFDAALKLDAANVTARFYQGLAAEQDGKRGDAVKIWRALLADALESAPWTKIVRQALARAESSESSGPAAPSASTSIPAPHAEPGEVIRGMVERLSARLHQDGSDADGWVRLVRSYMVLGEKEKAQAALADARNALKSDPAKLHHFEEGARSIGISPDGGPEASRPAAPGLRATTSISEPQAEQERMIRGMVERLSARLHQDGSDADGWVRLVRSYMVLGEKEKAQAAVIDARRALKSEPDKLRRFEDHARSLGIDG
jgi:cytochrome c-type biogenesis protein CcmH